MEKTNIPEIEFELQKLIMRYSDLFDYYQWPSEHQRWIELIFALIATISDKPKLEIRVIIEELDNLGLLYIEELFKIPKSGKDINFKSPLAKRIIKTLTENRSTEGGKISGFNDNDSKKCLLVMYEAAKSLMEHHDGKIQKYLRKYGQLMIDEINKNFSFSSLDKDNVKDAFTYWLQNVLNMPIHWRIKTVETFCKDLSVTYEDLLKEADNLDLNIALLDDMVDAHMQNIKEEGKKNG